MKNNHIKVIFFAVVLAIAAAEACAGQRGPEPDVEYPMTNQHIEWTYAERGSME